MWKIYTDEIGLDQGVPQSLIDDVKRFQNIERMEQFTAYDEGCPEHPSWPAMHSAGSAMSTWLPAIMELSEEEYCQVLLTDYWVSYARTVAGVHYVTDNIAGLTIGSKVVAEKMPRIFQERYGGDIVKIEEKFNLLHFNWADFDPATCGFRGESAGQQRKLLDAGLLRQS